MVLDPSVYHSMTFRCLQEVFLLLYHSSLLPRKFFWKLYFAIISSCGSSRTGICLYSDVSFCFPILSSVAIFANVSLLSLAVEVLGPRWTPLGHVFSSKWIKLFCFGRKIAKFFNYYTLTTVEKVNIKLREIYLN